MRLNIIIDKSPGTILAISTRVVVMIKVLSLNKINVLFSRIVRIVDQLVNKTHTYIYTLKIYLEC